MGKSRLFMTTIAVVAAMAAPAYAGTIGFNFSGPGVSGSLTLTYGTATDAKYPSAYEVTGISGTFSDSNHSLHIVNATVGSLVPITHDTPEPTNLFSAPRFQQVRGELGSAPADQWLLDLR